MKFEFFCTEKEPQNETLFIITVSQTSSMHVSAFVLVTIISFGVSGACWNKALEEALKEDYSTQYFLLRQHTEWKIHDRTGYGPWTNWHFCCNNCMRPSNM